MKEVGSLEEPKSERWLKDGKIAVVAKHIQYKPWYIVIIHVHLQNLSYYILLLSILFIIYGVFLVRYMSFSRRASLMCYVEFHSLLLP